MKTFRTRTYEISSPKLHGKSSVRFALLADLHGLIFGEDNETLIGAIEKAGPDAVLVAGDMIVRTIPESLDAAQRLMERLTARFPVYYAPGNHEYKLCISEKYREEYFAYEAALEKSGVHMLHNTRAKLEISGTDFYFHGLELPLEYYKKPFSPKLSAGVMEQLVGTPVQEGVHVLLAHNPKYGNAYFSWGADLIVSGHYHGGVMRLTEHHGLTCPQYLLFPPFCCGDFHRGSRHMIVSAGLGEHTIPVRIHNPRELLFIDMKPE